ncbi:hypothetical protein GBAR_LOCUS3130 [Geodia barretti]|uniref:Uncharacterized protein n=1 Tax=Geodia barretti TaxID=519541 RepID=A0AA35R384_GEOBA|nr:hypothetical protein GBAR_LOCUS3130 [Geodia barretti]
MSVRPRNDTIYPTGDEEMMKEKMQQTHVLQQAT